MKTDTKVRYIGKKHFGKVGIVANDYYYEFELIPRKDEVVVDFDNEEDGGINVFIVKKNKLEIIE